MEKQALIGSIWGDPVDRLIEELWDRCADYVQHRSVLYARNRAANRDLIRAAMPASVEDTPDAQLIGAMKAELTWPRYLYVNRRQWEDAPPKLHAAAAMMNLTPLTSDEIPADTSFLTIDEFNPDDLGKAMRRGQKLPHLH